MYKVGIIGAGVMGTGIAQNLAESGMNVVLVDLSDELLDSAKEKIYVQSRMALFFKKDKGGFSPDEILKKIKFTTNYEELQDVEYVIENVKEDFQLKKEVYLKIDKICNKEAVFLVNTSCISITEIAAVTNRADKVIGTHFMNPVPIKNTIEAIKGYHTSELTIEKTNKLLSEIGKEMILVNDYPGFVSNRVSHLLMNEACYVVQDNVATPEQIDKIFTKCFEHKMGPLATADLIGLDTVMNSLDILYKSYQDTKYRCCPLLRKMVNAGLLGRKSGKGFFEYEN